MLEDLEAKLVQVQPHIYPTSVHSRPFPKMECNLDWVKGGNFSRAAVGEDTSYRKCPLFIYEAKDEERIFAIVRECKRLELEQTIFGDKAFWQIIPEKSDEGQRRRMDRWIFDQGCFQKSTGSASLYGCTNPDYKVMFKLEPGLDGVPVPSPGEYSVLGML